MRAANYRSVRRYLTSTLLLAGLSSAACSNYFLPLWSGGDSKVTARERESLKKCGNGKLTADGAKLVTRHPYLQSTSTTSTIIAWGSAADESAVVVREPGDDKTAVASVTAEYAGDRSRRRERLSEQAYDDRAVDAEDIYLVKAEVGGLEPGHLYCYQVMLADGRALTEPAPFATAAAPGTKEPVRFVMVGDTGNGSPAQAAVARRMSAEPFDFIVFMGDIAYTAGRANELQTNFFAVYRDFFKYVPAYPSIGNHERRTREGRPYFESFVLPEPERYYSFDWGDIHFVALDTTERDREQLAWLEKDLANQKRRWVIAFGHHAMYSNALRDGQQVAVRQSFAKILTDHKVDLVVMGHEHHYERFRIADVNYIVSGGGGGRLHKFRGASQALKQATVHHFLAFEVTDTKLVMRAIDIDGKEIEKLELDKPAAVDDAKVKVDEKPDETQNPVKPEKKVVPDEKVHDKPDDDVKKEKVDPKAPKKS
jgi:3',5'-cyclic AMP phosphodiesterase CpdA